MIASVSPSLAEPEVHFGQEPSVLTRIAEPSACLCLWLRELPAAFSAWISGWLSQLEFSIDVEERIEEVAPRFLERLRQAGCSEDQRLHWLVDDIEMLAAVFARVAGKRRIRLRLTTVRDAGCEKFHADTLELRLLCTYAGPGTEWVEPSAVKASQLARAGGSVEEANRLIVPEGKIRVMDTGAVALFKGRLYPDHSGLGLVHRSAPVCCIRDYRLRLCLDLPR
jgi:hypothetical protein